MMSGTSTRHILRAATAGAHERVDRLFSRFHVASAEDYARFLSIQAAALLPLEAAIDRSPAHDVLPGWPSRRRGALILADLAELDAPAPVVGSAHPIDSPAAVFGTAYVLEGSRLGGQLIARTVPAARPIRFLSAQQPGQWRAFVDALDKTVISPGDRALAVDAALKAFAMFEQAAAVEAEKMPS